MGWTDDILADFEKHDAKKEKWLESRPICCVCGEAIQEEQMIYYNDQHCHPLIECESEFWQGIREDFLEYVD